MLSRDPLTYFGVIHLVISPTQSSQFTLMLAVVGGSRWPMAAASAPIWRSKWSEGRLTQRWWSGTMKGRLASRAHSFKENILGAFGQQHGGGGQQGHHGMANATNTSGKSRTASSSSTATAASSDASGHSGGASLKREFKMSQDATTHLASLNCSKNRP